MQQPTRWILGGALLAALVAALWAADVFSTDDPAAPEQARTDNEAEGDLTADDEKGAALHGTGEADDERLEVPPEVTGPRITGRVVDAQGNPVPGARVISFPDTLNGVIDAARLESDEYPGGQATTSADGRFVVPVTEDAPFHHLVAAKDGFSPALAGPHPAMANVDLEVEPSITMQGIVKASDGTPVPGAQVDAWILVEAFLVRRSVRSDEAGRYTIPEVPAEIVHAGGRHRGYFSPNWFEVRAAGYAPLLVEHVAPKDVDGTPTFDFTLGPGATLTGRVIAGGSNAPIAGVRVVLTSIEGLHGYGRVGGGSFSNPFAPRIVAETTTDATGGYRFEHVPSRGAHPSASHNHGRDGKPALGSVIAVKAGYSVGNAGIPIEAAGAEIERELTLWPAAVVTGRVMGSDGEPWEGATVSVSVKDRARGGGLPKSMHELPSYWAKTGADGRFHIAAAPADPEGATEGQLTVWPGRGKGSSGRQPQTLRQPVTFEAGKPTDLGDLVLEIPAAWDVTKLRVLRPDGTPYFGATVSRGARYSARQERTDKDGLFTLRWPPATERRPRKAYGVVVRAKGFAPAPARIEPPGEGEEITTVTLSPARFVGGLVLDADGEPVEGASVSVGDGNLPVDTAFPKNQRFVGRTGGLSERGLPTVYGLTRTGADGRFQLEDLPDGPYHVRATFPRRVAALPGTANGGALVGLVSGVPSDDAGVEIRLPRDDSPQLGTLAGQVVDVDGKSIAGLRLTVRKDGKNVAYAYANPRTFGAGVRGRIDGEGRFEIPNVPEGTVELTISASGFATQKLEIKDIVPDETTQVPTIRLGRGVRIQGRATYAGKLGGRKLSFVDKATRHTIQAEFGKDGRFEATGFVPGTYELFCYQQGFGRDPEPPLLPESKRTIEVKAGATTIRLDVRLIAAGSLYLAPDDPRLPPMPWSSDAATVEQIAFGKKAKVRVTDSQGAVVLEHVGLTRGGGNWSNRIVAPGRYTCRIELPGEDAKETTVTIKAGGRARVTWK